MAQEKYVSAEQLLTKLRSMSGKQWAMQSYQQQNYYSNGNADLGYAMQMMGQQIDEKIARSINQAMNMMVWDLIQHVESSQIDGGQCYLCKPLEHDRMPEDIRPLKSCSNS